MLNHDPDSCSYTDMIIGTHKQVVDKRLDDSDSTIHSTETLEVVRCCECDWLLVWPPVLSWLNSVHLILQKLDICNLFAQT